MREDRHDESNHAQKSMLILVITVDIVPSFSVFENFVLF
jgi:hypothetical protein